MKLLQTTPYVLSNFKTDNVILLKNFENTNFYCFYDRGDFKNNFYNLEKGKIQI